MRRMLLGCVALLGACAPAARGAGESGSGGSGGSGAGSGGTGGSISIDAGVSGPCQEAMATKQSVGCEYYATYMDSSSGGKACFAAVVANTSEGFAHIDVEYGGQALPVADFTRIPSGSGPSLSYAPFDAESGLAPGQVAILFLSGEHGESKFLSAKCPVPTAVPDVYVGDDLNYKVSGIGKSFRITTDLPVVAFQINPFGGGIAATTGSSLLLPTSAWDESYVAANAWGAPGRPSLNIVAMADDTRVTLVPVAPVEGGGGIPAGPANVPLTIELGRGEHAQISQYDVELSGSMLSANRPIGLMAGHQCMKIPEFGPCDHGEQMVPPIRALGSEYVAVMHRPRKTEPAFWRVIGAVDGTKLSWSSEVGGPATLERGQVAMFNTDQPFVVKSQDSEHPFILFQHMTSNGWEYLKYFYLDIGDPESVLGVPPEQFMSKYVFFTDPTYPDTHLVLVRKKKDGVFHDVELDCAGVVGGWQPLGDYEWTRVPINTGNFEPVGACNTGRREAWSEAPFGLWVWGWGSPLTGDYESGIITTDVSYGFPGGMNVERINQVELPVPR